MFSSADNKLLDQIFNLKFTSKQLVRASRKCETEEKAEKIKIKKAIEKGASMCQPLAEGWATSLADLLHHPTPVHALGRADNHEGAKIYAQNAIRKRAEALNYLRLASRLDAVVSRLDTQAKMQVRRQGDRVGRMKRRSAIRTASLFPWRFASKYPLHASGEG